MKVPTGPNEDATCDWRGENYQLFNCIEPRPTEKSSLGGCSNVYFGDVPGLDPAIKKTKFYELIWHLVKSCTKCKFKSVSTVKQYYDRVVVLRSIYQHMIRNKEFLCGLRLETRIVCTVRLLLCLCMRGDNFLSLVWG